MKEWLRKIVTPHFDDEQLNMRAFNLNVILLATSGIIFLGIIVLLFMAFSQPPSYVFRYALILAGAALLVATCYHLSRIGRVQMGGIIFVTVAMVGCVVALVLGGTLGALGVVFIIPVAVTGIVLSSNAGLAMAALSMVCLIVLGLLEGGGVIKVVYPDLETAVLTNLFNVGLSLFFGILSIWLAGYSLSQALKRTRQAVVETDRYRRQLEESLDAEAGARNHLQRAISQYSAFLTRIGQGDYTARLSLSQQDKDLASLERQINATIDTLVAALARSEAAREDMEAAQADKVVAAWRDYVRARALLSFEATPFELPWHCPPKVLADVCQGGQVGTLSPEGMTLREALRPALKEALTRTGGTGGESQAGQSDACAAVATPIKLRGQVIGALGLGREAGGRPWTQEERALIEAVAERLALAADNMRLREDTQRQAARERLIGEVTARMRETLDVETVLKTAAREVRQALGLPELVVRLGGPASNGDGEGEEVRS